MSATRTAGARWALVGLASEIVFTLGWLVAAAWQGPGYSPIHHDISEMGALTAPYPWAFLLPQALAGAASIAFVLFGLRPALRGAGRAGWTGPWLVALSGLQDLTDAVFRLDCRAADGCDQAQTAASWHGQVHNAIGFCCVLIMAISPFVLARRFRRLPEWRRLALPSLVTGGLFIAGLVLVVAPATAVDQGLTQRAMAALGAAWGSWVAIHLYRLTRQTSVGGASRAATVPANL